MTITDNKVQALLDACREALLVCRWAETVVPIVEYARGLSKALEILGLSAEAEQIRKEIAG